MGNCAPNAHQQLLLRPDNRYYEKLAADQSWPQEDGYASYAIVARAFNLSVSEVLTLCEALEAFEPGDTPETRWANFPAPCLRLELPVTIPVAVNGEILEPTVPKKLIGDKRRQDGPLIKTPQTLDTHAKKRRKKEQENPSRHGPKERTGGDRQQQQQAQPRAKRGGRRARSQ